ncbi:hypothetical protein GOV05_05865 [Candidatus Woesearchaeota archaeon]|nr:hypothetical protein [Candidatus Woesearchaeota archaeon]
MSSKKDLRLLEEKLNLIQTEVFESKIYIEISLITLVFIFFAFFTEQSFVTYVLNNKVLAVFIVLILSVLSIMIIYLLSHVILVANNRKQKIKKEKNSALRDWTE